jgi:pimeloyl-ACP methyl ester carboxylesterase
MGPAWFEGMALSNVAVFSPDMSDEEVVREITLRADALSIDPGRLLRRMLTSELSSADRAYLNDPDAKAGIQASHDEAVLQGPGGWVDDVLALRRHWGFDLWTIQEVPVHITQSTGDGFTPVGHGKWMHREIPGSTLEVIEEHSHFALGHNLLGRLAFMGVDRAGQ